MDNKFEWIIDNFDFAKVQSIMVFLGMKWAGNKTPTVEEMKSMCRNLYEGMKDEDFLISSGGFSLEYCEDNLYLSFIPVSCSSEFMGLGGIIEENKIIQPF